MPTPTIPQLLDFAAAHPDIRGEVDGMIRRELGPAPARYCQVLMGESFRSPFTWRHENRVVGGRLYGS